MANYGSAFFGVHPIFVLEYNSLKILDVNETAIQTYGYSRKEFLQKDIADLGLKETRPEMIRSLKGERASDKVWEHRTKSNSSIYVQFTTHLFNHNNTLAKLVVAHNVSRLMEKGRESHDLFPRAHVPGFSSPLAIVEWNADLTIKSWSDRAEQLFGWTEEDVFNNPGFLSQFVHKEELALARKRLKNMFDSGILDHVIEGRNYTKDGAILHCEWHNSVLYDSNGEVISIYSQVHDISDRKQSEKLFRALSEESLVGVYLIQDGIFKYINPQFARIHHYKKEEIEGKMSPLELTHPEDKKLVEENITMRIKGSKESIDYEFRGTTKDNQTIYVRVYGSRIEYKGRPAVIGTLVDVTDSKLAFERYEASLKSFEDLFASISDAIYIQNKEGEFIEVNEGAAKMYGYDPEYFIGKDPGFLAAPGMVDMEKTKQLIKKALNGEPQKFEWWGKRKNGEIFPKEVVTNPGTYFGEKVIITIARDISERYKAQEEIRKNEELFRQLFQNAHIGIVMMDEHQDIRLANTAFEELFGYRSKDIAGMNIDQLIVPEEEAGKAREISEAILDGSTEKMTSRRLRKDGSLVDVLIYGVPVRVNRQTIAIFGLYVDITERKEAEEQIRHSLREKEVLLAEIHHRVKNNLAVITGLLELQSYNTSSDEAKNVLRESQLRINSIALIHEKLYQSEDLAQISFDVYIRELTDVIIRSIANTDKSIKLDIQAEKVFLTINEAIPCGLILNELITNSFKHAFSDKQNGTVSISLSEKEGEITLKVKDDGKGWPENINMESLDSLGLTLIRTLSAQLKGDYIFKNEGEGAAFRLRFKRERRAKE